MTYPFRYRQPKQTVAVRNERRILAASLTELQRRALWEGIKLLDKGLAELITNDAGYLEMKNEWQAELTFSPSDLNRFIDSGLKLIEEKNHAQPI